MRAWPQPDLLLVNTLIVSALDPAPPATQYRAYVDLLRKRPLAQELVEYAAGDVAHLLTIAHAQGALDSQLARMLSQLQVWP